VEEKKREEKKRRKRLGTEVEVLMGTHSL